MVARTGDIGGGAVYTVPRRRTRWVGLAALGLAGCASLGDAFSDLNFFTVQDDRQFGEEAYGEVLSGQRTLTSGSTVRAVERLVGRLVQAARDEDPELVDAFEWQVTVIDDDQTANAFALPGGKIAVYTGILPVTQSDAGLAVVLGHEIAHVTERHGTEAMTRRYGAAAITALFLGTEEDKAQLAAIATELAFHMPFGRNAELEADRVGLRIMARAGHDPREAVAFWQRMEALGGGAPPEWLSTHPSHGTRIDQIRSLLPEALSIYEANRAGGQVPLRTSPTNANPST